MLLIYTKIFDTDLQEEIRFVFRKCHQSFALVPVLNLYIQNVQKHLKKGTSFVKWTL